MSETTTPEAPEQEAEVPTPADVARDAEEAKRKRNEDSAKPDTDEEKRRKHFADLRSENKALRERLKEAEPVLQAAQEAEEARKTEAQKAVERAEAAERERDEEKAAVKRLRLGLKFGIPEDRIHLIPHGSEEDMERDAAHLGELYAATTKPPAPPSDRPVEGLRPGASPDSPKPADDSYPAAWAPPHIREKNRSQYGQ